MKANFTLSNLFTLVIAFVFFFGNSGAVYAADPGANCPDNMILLLRLDESSGPTYADYLGVHTGTASTSPSAVTGKINGAQLFNDNTFLNVPEHGDEFDFGTGSSFSIEIWIKTSVTTAQVGIARYRTDTPTETANWWLGIDNNGYGTMEIRDNWQHNSVLKGNVNLADNQWHHLVGVRNGALDQNLIYIDGVLANTLSNAGLDQDFAMPLPTDVTLGYLLRKNDWEPHYHFNGSLDEAAVFNRALTATEVASFYNNGNPDGHCASVEPPPVVTGNCPSDLLLLLALDEASGPTYADTKGVNNGIASNSPTAVSGIVNGGQLFNANTKINIADNGSDFEWAAGCSFTLEFWIKSATHDIPQVGISRQIAGSGITWWLGINEYGGAVMELKDSHGNNFAVYNKNFSTSYTDNQWHHIVGVKDGTTNYLALYVDGELIEGKTAVFDGNFIAPSPTEVSVGYMLRADGSSYEYHVNGDLDEVAVFTRALSPSEILSFYNNGAPSGHCKSGYKTAITTTPVTTATEDVPYTYTFKVNGQDGDVLTLGADSKPGWLNFNWTPGQKSAVLSGTPAHSDIGTANVKLSVNDGDSTLYQEFSIQVSGVNHIPVITGQNALSTNEDTPITLSKSDLTITDSDNPPSDLTLQVLAGSNYTFSGNMITPDANYNGSLSVNVIVTDLVGQSIPYPVLITVLPVNDVPVITTDPQTIADINHLYRYDLVAVDADEDVLTITATSKPAWLSFTAGSGTAVLSGTPTIDQIGSYDIVLKVNDGYTDTEQLFTIDVMNINDLPVITGQNSLDVDEDQSLTLSKSNLFITDEDNPSTDLTLHVLAGSNYSFNGNMITADANYCGSLSVNAAVNDLEGQGPVYQVAVSVNCINDAPVITSDPALSVQSLTLYSYQMTVEDVDKGEILTLIAVSKPDWLNFNWTPGQKSAVLTGTPADVNIGTANVILRVNDGDTNVDQSFSINVVAFSSEIPVITGQDALVVDEDHSIVLTKSNLHITDADNTNAEITIQVLAGIDYSFDGNIITPAANYSGQLSVNVVAKDLVGQSEVYPVMITVNPVNDLPVITSNPELTIHSNNPYIYQMTIEDADEGDVLTITALSKPDWLTFNPGSNSAILMGVPALSDAGSYNIILNVNDGHADVLQGFVLVVSGPSGIVDIDNTMIESVYPNPASDKIYFKFANMGNAQIELFDISGSLQKKVNVENERVLELNIADMANGIYVYKVYQSGKISTGKFTKN